MAVKSLAQSSLRQNPQINSMLAGYQPNAFHHLETVRLGGNASSVEFTNLARYSDYQHLQIRAVIRANDTTGLTYVRFNGDTGNNYSWHWLVGNGNSVQSNGGGSASAWFGYASAKGTEATGYFSAFVMDVLDPFEAKNKTLRMFSGTPGNLAAGLNLHSGAWYNTTALSSISVYPNATTWAAGSRFSLYGIKARA